MHTEDRFYDYRAKYLPEEQVDLRVPAGLEPQVERRVQELALQCFTALDCEGWPAWTPSSCPMGRC